MSSRITTARRLSQVSSHLGGGGGGGRGATTTTITQQQSQRPPLAPDSTEFRYFVAFQSTWRDNDSYNHFNNVVYSQYFDSITNDYLLNECRMNRTTDPIGLIVQSETRFASQLKYPDPVVAALSISELTRRKIVWRVALFKAEYVSKQTSRQGGVSVRNEVEIKEGTKAAAWGTMTHVFVERGGEQNKVVERLPESWLEPLGKLLINHQSQ